GERRLKLALWTCVAAMMNRAEAESFEPDPIEEMRDHRREADGAMAVLRVQHAEKRRARAALEDLWEEPVRPPSRRRPPGPNQLRILAVLVRYADDPQMGLPVAAVRRIARIGADKANVLRAVRTLVRSGILQRSRDGERLRLTDWRTSLLRHHVPFMVDPPLSDEKAEAVLEAFGEPGGVSPRRNTPWTAEKLPEPG
ncbi:MAG: hypothetical protein M3R38_13000, partial [Actinomycetota bacterium]|nr:hypothetical protein [Actinomycetota bacterium]